MFNWPHCMLVCTACEDSERERAAVVQLDEKAREQVPSQSQP